MKTDEVRAAGGAEDSTTHYTHQRLCGSEGSDPEATQRIVLVTGHYDSRNTNVLDTTGGARRGRNDDASGVAVSLESARALAKLKLRATVIFLTVAGEEQGLDGAKHFARMAKQSGWNIEAALDDDIVGAATGARDRTPASSGVFGGFAVRGR